MVDGWMDGKECYKSPRLFYDTPFKVRYHKLDHTSLDLIHNLGDVMINVKYFDSYLTHAPFKKQTNSWSGKNWFFQAYKIKTSVKIL